MLDSASRSPFELLHAYADATIATIAGGLVLLVFYPVTLCAGAVKSIVTILGLRTREGQEGGERRFAGRRPANQDHRSDGQRRQPVAHS